MKNHVQPGRYVTVPAPAPVASGAGVLIGSLFGVATTDAASGADIALAVEGVFELPKEATSTSFDLGDAVEWDAGNDRIAALNTGVKIGVVVAAAGATATTAKVRLTA